MTKWRTLGLRPSSLDHSFWHVSHTTKTKRKTLPCHNGQKLTSPLFSQRPQVTSRLLSSWPFSLLIRRQVSSVRTTHTRPLVGEETTHRTPSLHLPHLSAPIHWPDRLHTQDFRRSFTLFLSDRKIIYRLVQSINIDRCDDTYCRPQSVGIRL